MTENGTWTGEYLASDVWGIEKSMEATTPEEELKAWRTTTGMLNHLCAMADDLMLEPLILALADALNRAREEERRAEDRLTRPEGAELGPRERERLMGLLRCCDAFGMGMDAYGRDPRKCNPRDNTELREEVVAVLQEEYDRAREEFHRYRAEVGLPD
jgi:hypothetical protein